MHRRLNSIFIRILVLAVSVMSCSYILVFPRAVDGLFGFEFRGQDVSLFHAALTFVMTFLGVIFSLVIQRNKNIIDLGWAELGRSLLAYTTPGSLIVSTIVYAYAFQALYDLPGDWVAYFSALQSGFFFNQTLSTVMSNIRPQGAETS